MIEFCVGMMVGSLVSMSIIFYELNRHGQKYEEIGPLLKKLAINLKKYEK